MIELNTKEICSGVNFTNIHDNRFKTARISATFFTPLSNDTVSANGILPYIITRSCKQYPDFAALNKKLSSLYGASIYSDVGKNGDNQVLVISAVGIDDKYSLDGQSVSKELARLLCSIIFEPDLENGRFKSENIEQERRQLIEAIDAEYNNKRIFAKNRCEQTMCANEKSGISPYGTKEQAESLTSDEIYNAWKNVLKTARVEITMMGDSSPELAMKMFMEAFSKVERKNIVDCSTEIVRKAPDTVKEKQDVQTIKQCKLVMGLRAGVCGNDDDVMATRIMVALLGGTPHSKLFLNVREKYSLCYYCAAKYERYKGIIFIESGVEQKNIERAKEEIMNQLKAIQNGDFDDDEVNAAKLSLCNSFKTVSDSIGSLESWYISQTFENKKMSPEQTVEELKKVTRQQIIDAANKVTLDTVYTLVGNKEEN